MISTHQNIYVTSAMWNIHPFLILAWKKSFFYNKLLQL